MTYMNEAQTEQAEATENLRPTKKQKELLAYIEQFIGEHGYSPSYREIMNGLQYTSVATVALHVGNLIKRGHIRKRDRSARSLEVVNPSTVSPVVLPTNQIKPAEEKWLVDKVEQLLVEAEASPVVTPEQLENLYILVSSLRILGSDGAAQSFLPRLAQLKNPQTLEA